jgi:hypothetical protein
VDANTPYGDAGSAHPARMPRRHDGRKFSGWLSCLTTVKLRQRDSRGISIYVKHLIFGTRRKSESKEGAVCQIRCLLRY